MSEWRPLDWPKSPCDDCEHEDIDDYGYYCDLWCGKRTGWANRETGADAILGALRGAGQYFGVGEVIDEPNFTPSGGRWMNQAGTMVFIPDKE